VVLRVDCISGFYYFIDAELEEGGQFLPGAHYQVGSDVVCQYSQEDHLSGQFGLEGFQKYCLEQLVALQSMV